MIVKTETRTDIMNENNQDVKLLIRKHESRNQFTNRVRIPYPNDMFIASYQLWSFEVKSTMPLYVQYGTAIPV